MRQIVVHRAAVAVKPFMMQIRMLLPRDRDSVKLIDDRRSDGKRPLQPMCYLEKEDG